jgi:hypothetical protein
MKIFVRFCLCAVVPLVFVGAATNVARAQQSVSVSPEVKADTLRRLEFAKTWEVPKQKGFVSTRGSVGEKTVRNICNGKPDKNYDYTQVTGCFFLMGRIAVVHSVDDMMPGYKACALDTTKRECMELAQNLASLGFYDYALAVLETGYVADEGSIYLATAPGLSPGGFVFYIKPGSSSLFFARPASNFPNQPTGQELQVGDLQDVRALLRSFCLAHPAPTWPSQADACYLANAAGAAVSQQEVAQASSQRLTAESQSEQEKATAERQFERAGDAQDARLNAISNAVSAVAASTPTIQEAAAQNQANLQAMAVAAQQRQQAQEQARLAAEQSARAAKATTTSDRSALSNTNASSSAATVVSPSTPNPTNNPYSSTSAQGSYNPYTGTGSGSTHRSCTDMTGSVQGTVKVGSDGWVSGYLTNNSNQALFVSYTFKQNGVPSNAMANSGGTTIQGGQTVGGEGQGLYSTGADKNPPEIYWYAVLKSDHDKYGCVHKW